MGSNDLSLSLGVTFKKDHLYQPSLHGNHRVHVFLMECVPSESPWITFEGELINPY